ncbi:hypothetical protein BV25DRAFT_1918925 [Artomyces pyxidatus]|uniref:Uncharacterized protein n=1 Tax=Artomyces pyxidatus TaxID=48021 RepID=A0ACB8SQE3_9AGAM|nr:hypothetical protein BV25DRAFT_1918925 [Artomyces pyxidatus]
MALILTQSSLPQDDGLPYYTKSPLSNLCVRQHKRLERHHQVTRHWHKLEVNRNDLHPELRTSKAESGPPQYAHQSTRTDYGAPFDDTDADVILESCDKILFFVYKSILCKASPFFKAKFSASRFQQNKDVRPHLTLPENGATLALLLTLCYPLEDPDLVDLEAIAVLLAAAKKYDMARAHAVASRSFRETPLLRQHPAKAFGIACDFGLEEQARIAARTSLQQPFSLEYLQEDVRYLDGRALWALMTYRKKCKDAVISLTRDSVWIGERAQELWDWTGWSPGCACHRGSKLFDNDNAKWQACAAWAGYMQDMEQLMARLSNEAAIVRDEVGPRGILLSPALYKEAESCDECMRIVDKSLIRFSTVFAVEVRWRISQVGLVMVP